MKYRIDPDTRPLNFARGTFPLIAILFPAISCFAGTKTWDGKYDTSKIDLQVVYFVPADRQPLSDWHDRAEYYCRRIEQFHAREFQGQSTLKAVLHAEPLISESSTAELRRGNGDAIFFRTLREVDRRLGPAVNQPDSFPILLVLSEINWRPLDDFYRVHPKNGRLEFEGNYHEGEHFPGATSGGARATYLADRGVGWGLVSADGWRVPYRGSDCVVYHEGVGHTVGLPHPEPGNGSVMSLGQYRGWLSESWLDKDQKIRLGWKPDSDARERVSQTELFTSFRALPEPKVPRPGQPILLAMDWPEQAIVKSLKVRFQTAVEGPWIDVPQQLTGELPRHAVLGTFDRATPLSYRIEAELQDGSTSEIWGYLQVRIDPDRSLMPYALSPDLLEVAKNSPQEKIAAPPDDEIDLLQLIDPASSWQVGKWSMNEGKLNSPKQPLARLELPYSPPPEYRLTLIVEPLDEPNGLILGQRSQASRFVTLINYVPENEALSALENVDGRNVGNATTYRGGLFQKNRLSQVIVTVNENAVSISVDGRLIVDWKGRPDRLSLDPEWNTPQETALFLGAYDCGYRFHRITLEPISGAGKNLKTDPQK